MDEMMVEDKLNDEVRTILEEYSVYMANNAISYSEMFRRIKNQLVQQRKIVRAAGRNTGDPMRLSRDKVNEISHRLLTALKKSRKCRIRRNENDLRLEIVRIISDILQNEHKTNKAARAKIRTLKREVLDGTEEWDLLPQALRRRTAELRHRSGALGITASPIGLKHARPHGRLQRVR